MGKTEETKKTEKILTIVTTQWISSSVEKENYLFSKSRLQTVKQQANLTVYFGANPDENTEKQLYQLKIDNKEQLIFVHDCLYQKVDNSADFIVALYKDCIAALGEDAKTITKVNFILHRKELGNEEGTNIKNNVTDAVFKTLADAVTGKTCCFVGFSHEEGFFTYPLFVRYNSYCNTSDIPNGDFSNYIQQKINDYGDSFN